MERCDFASVTTIIKSYISEDQEKNQMDFIYLLFDSFISSDTSLDYEFDNGLVCRWFSGQARVSKQIINYYRREDHWQKWTESICKNLLPKKSRNNEL